MEQKVDLYEVIDSNIVPNNVKGITGQSLKNTLYAMADKIGEGGGASVLQIMLGDVSADMELGTFSTTLSPEETVKNVEIFNILKESKTPQLVGVDLSDMFVKLYEIMGYGDMTGVVCMTIFSEYVYSPESVAMLEGLSSEVISLFFSGGDSIILLMPDGTLDLSKFNL